jgi:hypothetical protein
MAKCGSCVARKGKRNCPALGAVICPQCCGTKRQKEIDCPPDCFFLGKSKEYFTDRQEAGKLSDFERQMKSIIGKEDPYADVLQNIELMISKIYKDRGNITDRHVEAALEHLMEMGKARLDLPAKFLTELSPNVQSIVDGVNDILEFRESIGRREDLITRLKCVYRVLDSVRTHHDPKDDCSYLTFIGHFMR